MKKLFKLPALLLFGSSTLMMLSCSKLPSSQQNSQSAEQSSQAASNLSQSLTVTVKDAPPEGTSRPPVIKRQEKLTRIIFGKLSDIYIDTNNDQPMPLDYPIEGDSRPFYYEQPARDFTLEISTGTVYATDSYEKLYKLTVSERLQLIRLFKGVSIQTSDYLPVCAMPAYGFPGSYAAIQLSSGASYDLDAYCVSYRILDANGNNLNIHDFVDALSKKVLSQLNNDPYAPVPGPLAQ